MCLREDVINTYLARDAEPPLFQPIASTDLEIILSEENALKLIHLTEIQRN